MPNFYELPAALESTSDDYVLVVQEGRLRKVSVGTLLNWVSNHAPNDAVKLLDANGWQDVTLSPTPSGNSNQDRYLRGGDFDTPLWSTNSAFQWWMLAIVGNSNPSAWTNYAEQTFKTVALPNGESGTALSLTIKADAPQTSSEQIRLTDYQEAGVAGSGGRTEPVFYQRMWIKFDTNILERAQRVGPSDFYQILWEPKCEPDFRLRIQLQYNGTDLYWVAHDDVLTNADAIHAGSNATVPVTLAPLESPLGWHKIEVFIDRPNGIWRAAVNGSDIINLNFGEGTDLYGASGNIMNFPMFLQLYSDVSIPFSSDGPMEMLCANLELWDKPPADAWLPYNPIFSFNPNHFIVNKGWADTLGHASGPGGTYSTLRVTNLNASGPGSLRAALETSGARLIVFEVSGTIDLDGTYITVSNPYLTVAGQTAPSPGISIIKGGIVNATHDAIYSHLLSFVGQGAEAANPEDPGQETIETLGGSYNVIIDHCGAFWGLDGNIDIAGYPWTGANATDWRNNTSHHVTVSASVIAENMGSGGMLLHDNSTYLLVDRNYFYSCRGRNGHYKGGTRGASTNNLIYNPMDKFFDYTLDKGPWDAEGNGDYQEGYIDLIGNVCRAGPSSSNTESLFMIVSNNDANLYLHDNEAKRTNGTDYPDTVTSSYLGDPVGQINIVTSPNTPNPGNNYLTKAQVPSWILSNVGPRPWDRHAQVTRVLNHYLAGTGSHPSDESSVGGYPTLESRYKEFNPSDWNLTTIVPDNPNALDTPWSPKDLPGLQAWYKFRDKTFLFQNQAGTTAVTSADQLVRYVHDLSGNGNHAISPSNGSRVTYREYPDGFYGISITDGQQLDIPTLNSLVEGTNPWWAAFALRRVQGTTNTWHTFLYRSISSGYALDCYLEADGGNSYSVCSRTIDSGWTGASVALPNTDVDLDYVVSVGYNGTQALSRLGTGTAAVGTSGSLGTGSDGDLRIGGSTGGTTFAIYEAVICNAVPSPENQTLILEYLNGQIRQPQPLGFFMA